MKVTLDFEACMGYIYLLCDDKRPLMQGNPRAKGHLLFDRKGDWLGIELSNRKNLPPIRGCDFPLFHGAIVEKDDRIQLLFDGRVNVASVIECNFLLDISANGGVYGIEIFGTYQDELGGLNYVEPFIQSVTILDQMEGSISTVIPSRREEVHAKCQSSILSVQVLDGTHLQGAAYSVADLLLEELGVKTVEYLTMVKESFTLRVYFDSTDIKSTWLEELPKLLSEERHNHAIVEEVV